MLKSCVELAGRNSPLRPVTLRQTIPSSDAIYGERTGWIRSEALLRLDFGVINMGGVAMALLFMLFVFFVFGR